MSRSLVLLMFLLGVALATLVLMIGDIQIRYVRHQHIRILVPPQNLAQRRADLSR